MAEYPIPQISADAFLAYQEKSPQNAGLIFDRFAPNWGADAKIKENGLKAARDAAKKADLILLEAWNQRWEKLVQAANAQPFTMKTDWRLIAGLGRKGSLEVGFTFHRYGFPYLPGSSIKGLARASAVLEIAGAMGEEKLKQLKEKIAESNDKIGLLGALDVVLSCEEETVFKTELEACGFEDPKKIFDMAEAFRRMFGTTASAGQVVFFDAIPSAQALPVLEMDIVNPHYPEYYKEGGNEYPTNWQSPIPVQFLTVAAGTEFRFAVGWRDAPQDINKEAERKQSAWSWFKGLQTHNSGLDSQPQARLQKLAKHWLEGGLGELGAGSKTSAGYGYFSKVIAPPPPLPIGYQRGTVVSFGLGPNKSTGYIRPDVGSDDLFVHQSKLTPGLTGLEPGQRVTFKRVKVPNQRNDQAQDVKLDE